MAHPLMPKATAVWLVDNTTLTFEQIADFCGLHPLEVQAIADGEVAIGMQGADPIASGELTQEEIDRCQADPTLRLQPAKPTIPRPRARQRGARYTPVSKRQDRPDAIAWLLRNYPELSDGQIAKLIGTTKPTINAIREKTHWNMPNIKPQNPASLGLCSGADLEKAVAVARKRAEKAAASKPAPAAEPAAAEKPAAETTVAPAPEPEAEPPSAEPPAEKSADEPETSTSAAEATPAEAEPPSAEPPAEKSAGEPETSTSAAETTVAAAEAEPETPAAEPETSASAAETTVAPAPEPEAEPPSAEPPAEAAPRAPASEQAEAAGGEPVKENAGENAVGEEADAEDEKSPSQSTA